MTLIIPASLDITRHRKLAAYAYIARLQSQGRLTSTTFHADGAITVESAGLEPITFAEVRQ